MRIQVETLIFYFIFIDKQLIMSNPIFINIYRIFLGAILVINEFRNKGKINSAIFAYTWKFQGLYFNLEVGEIDYSENKPSFISFNILHHEIL